MKSLLTCFHDSVSSSFLKEKKRLLGESCFLVFKFCPSFQTLKKILWLGSFINWWLVGCILTISNRFTGDKCFWMYTVSHPPILEFLLFRKLGQRMKVQFPRGKPSPCFHNRETWLLSICSRDQGLVRSYRVTHRIPWVLKSLPSLLRICS